MLLQMKEAESKLQNEKNSLLQQLHTMEQEASQYQHQQRDYQQQLQQQQLEQETRLRQLQLQLLESQEQFEKLQQQHLQQQHQVAVDSETSSSAVHHLQQQLIAAQESQRLEAAAAAEALASNKCVKEELQVARDRIKYLESAISGHVTRLEAQTTELSGSSIVLTF